MSWLKKIANKIFNDRNQLIKVVEAWKKENKKIVFTNGCFDLLHLGHIDYLSKAADLGDRLIIGLNTDDSVSKLKGPLRPVINEVTRAHKLASMEFVDAVIYFNEETPLELINQTKPNVLVKGGDYTIATIVGSTEVIKLGGSVEVIPFLKGLSSTAIIERIKG